MHFAHTALLFLLATVPKSAEEVAPQDVSTPNEAITVFANTCMSHFFSKDDLHAKFENNKFYVRWPSEAESGFLKGQKGAVWGTRGKSSNYAITLLESDPICSVSAERSDDSAWNDFDKFLVHLFPGTELVPVSAEVAGPTTELTRSKGFRLRSKGKMLLPIFTITTSRDPSVQFEARLTIYFPDQPNWNPPHKPGAGV